MGLLQEIVAGATSSTKPVSELLRLVQILAVRGGARDLADWIRKERDGYGVNDPLPAYRGPFPAVVAADAMTPAMHVRGYMLPSTAFPEDFDHLFKAEFNSPIAEIEELANSDVNELQMPWPGEAIHYANVLKTQNGGVQIDPHAELISVYRKVGRNQLIAILDAVRSRILDLALELEQVSPQLGDLPGQDVQHKEEISAKFNANIIAHTVNLGETVAPNYGISITSGDTDSLGRYLRGLGVGDDAAVAELVEAAKTSDASELQKEDGKLMKTIKKVGGLVGGPAAAAGVELVKKAVAGYFGIPL